MRNRLRNIVLISVLFINIVLSVIIFLTVKNVENQFSNPAFWITWVSTVPINFLFWVFIYFNTAKAHKEDEVNLIPIFSTGFTANVIFIGVCFKTIYLPSDVYSWSTALIVQLVMLVIYAIALAFVTTGITYIRRNREHTRKKVFYIRDLSASLTAVFDSIKDSDTLIKVKQLAEDIRYSDPMSHESLLDVETEIKLAVNRIVEAAMQNDIETINNNVILASNKLKFRNTKCAILK